MSQPRDPDSGQFTSKGISCWATFLILFLLVACILAWKP